MLGIKAFFPFIPAHFCITGTAAIYNTYGIIFVTIDKFTIVIYLEGEDPDCLNNIIGGEIKMRMDIREEHVDDEK